MKNKYHIGAGFYNGAGSGSDWFFENLWWPNVCKLHASDHPPECVVILANGGSIIRDIPGIENKPELCQKIFRLHLKGNLGHVHQLIGKTLPAKSHHLCGWSAAMLTLAMIAYNDEADMIFLEQDCLAFGDWIGQLYAELGDKKMLFGKSKCMPVAQSLFIVSHSFIPQFVAAYIQLGTETNLHNLPEVKFHKLETMFPKDVGRFSFPFDRDRPIDYNLPVWYAQKFSPVELLELRVRGLIHFDQLPENVEKFTND